jgi:hypothetical protein
LPAAPATFSTVILISAAIPIAAGCGDFGSGHFAAVLLGARPRFARLTGFARLAGLASTTVGIEFFGILFLLFEKIGDVEESVPLESEVDKRGLHAGEDPGDTALINRAG